MLTWQGLEKTCTTIYFSDQNWVFGVINFEIQILPNIDWFWVEFFFHMVQYLVYYNFHIYKFGFYSHKNMIWLFEWKQSPRVLGFVDHCTSISRAIDGSPRIIKQDGLISTNAGAYYMHCNYTRLMMQMTH
jgi:hypothetical protein